MLVRFKTHPPCRHCKFDNNELALKYCKYCGRSLAPSFLSQLAVDTERIVIEIYLKARPHTFILAIVFIFVVFSFYYVLGARRECAGAPTAEEISSSPSNAASNFASRIKVSSRSVGLFLLTIVSSVPI